ncbi:hypothetical protein ACIRL2_42235 [Embleya sp. NPDC127516]|uniref:hypothetical protein n=1 Tax=Embleya sp. NPDC127516 TaxID=3363990 RepID=UPI00382D2007
MSDRIDSRVAGNIEFFLRRALRTEGSWSPASLADATLEAVHRGGESNEGVEVRGRLFRGGHADVPLQPVQPSGWRDPGAATLGQALDNIWGQAAEYFPEWVAAIRREVFGLVVVRVRGGDHVAYFSRSRRTPRGTQAQRLSDIDEPGPGAGAINVLWSGPPADRRFDDETIPASIRALAAAHRSLHAGDTSLRFDLPGTENLGDLLRERYEGAEPDEEEEDFTLEDLNEGVFDACFYLGHDNSAAESYFVDLHEQNSTVDPLVVTLSPDGANHGDRFGEWFDHQARATLLGL